MPFQFVPLGSPPKILDMSNRLVYMALRLVNMVEDRGGKT